MANNSEIRLPVPGVPVLYHRLGNSGKRGDDLLSSIESLKEDFSDWDPSVFRLFFPSIQD